MNAPAQLIGLGHNRPPLRELLSDAYDNLVNVQIKEACDSASRAPAAIEDDVTLGKFGDLVRTLTGLCKKADDARKAEKEPFLTAGRDVDGFFAPAIERATAAKKLLLDRQTAYLAAKEAAARAKAEAEAKSAREEEDRLLRSAQAAEDAGRIDDASARLELAASAETRGIEAATLATAKPADLARTYSDGGSVSTLKKEWTFEIQDRQKLALEPLRPYLPADAIDKAIRAYIRAGGRALPGVRIYEASKAMVR